MHPSSGAGWSSTAWPKEPLHDSVLEVPPMSPGTLGQPAVVLGGLPHLGALRASSAASCRPRPISAAALRTPSRSFSRVSAVTTSAIQLRLMSFTNFASVSEHLVFRRPCQLCTHFNRAAWSTASRSSRNSRELSHCCAHRCRAAASTADTSASAWRYATPRASRCCLTASSASSLQAPSCEVASHNTSQCRLPASSAQPCETPVSSAAISSTATFRARASDTHLWSSHTLASEASNALVVWARTCDQRSPCAPSSEDAAQNLPQVCLTFVRRCSVSMPRLSISSQVCLSSWRAATASTMASACCSRSFFDFLSSEAKRSGPT
mmetsp:Transcript_83825/g.232305  ORF Transcript_83825/g.232305 Transcript_83825/m.232305 type:complete len:323 (+) Transcript_83825:284-1252(+)